MVKRLLIIFFAVVGGVVFTKSLYGRYWALSGAWSFYDALVEMEQIDSFGLLADGENSRVKIWLRNGGFIDIGYTDVESVTTSNLSRVHQLGGYKLVCDFDGEDRQGSWPSLYGLSILSDNEGNVTLRTLIYDFEIYEKMVSKWSNRANAESVQYEIDSDTYRKFYPSNDFEIVAACSSELAPVYPNTMWPPNSGRRGRNFTYFQDEGPIKRFWP